MDQLQKEFQAIVEKIQAKAVDLARQESEEQITQLRRKLDRQTEALNVVKKFVEEWTFEQEADEKEREARLRVEPDEKGELNGPELHSIKDRLKHMGLAPENFSNTDLARIGRKMSAHYRKTYNGRDPEKKEERINDKHNSFVCAYSETDWLSMDALIKTELDPLMGSDEKSPLEEKKPDEPELHSVKDRLNRFPEDEQQHFANKDLCSIGKKMAAYYRELKGADPPQKKEKINDKHDSLVCAYPDTDWEHLDYLIAHHS